MSSKTPISMLHEMMSRQSKTPTYDLIHNGGGTHSNTFIYQVSCDNLVATGTGRCKKSAKHEAATAMLEKIAKLKSLPQLPASPAQIPIEEPLPTETPICPKSPGHVAFRNTVGELTEICANNNLDMPEYKEISDVGPAHAKLFTIQCIVSTFTEEGTSTTKKQAKHEAARKMIDRITEFISDDSNPITTYTCNRDKINEDIIIDTALDKYPNLSLNYKEAPKLKLNWGLKIVDYHKSFRDSFILEEEKKYEFFEKLKNLLILIQKYQENANEDIFAQLYAEFESMLELIDVKYYENILENSNKHILKGMRLNTAPDIYEIGIGKTENEASICALNSILQTVKFLLE